MPLEYLLAAIPIIFVVSMFQHVNKASRRAVASMRNEEFRRKVLSGYYDNHPSNHSRKEQ